MYINKIISFVNSRKDKSILRINNLSVKIKNNDEKIINDLCLQINEGEIHILMGKNGSGKSTISKVISGHPAYIIEDGAIEFKNTKLNNLDPSLRSLNGIFLCFQNPLEIHGVRNLDFLRKISNCKRSHLKKQIFDPLEFYKFINRKIKKVGLDPSFLSRDINVGFSGGEKKRNEILQLLTLEADLCIFDEVDSGLDVDSIKNIAKIITELKNNGSAILLITHYKKLLDMINPDLIPIIDEGKIIKSGGVSLVELIEKEGFDAFK